MDARADRSNIPALLQQASLLRGLDAADFAALAPATHKVALANRTRLFAAGDPCTGFYLVVFGCIKLVHSAQPGTERVLRLASTGDSFGEAEMLLERPRMMAAIATEDSLLLHLEQSAVLAQLARSPALAGRLLRSLSWQLYMRTGDLGAYIMRSGTQRLAGYLLREYEHRQSATVTLDVSKRTLASRLNLTPERFSRILHELADQGLIAVDDRSLTILDIDGLRREHGRSDSV